MVDTEPFITESDIIIETNAICSPSPKPAGITRFLLNWSEPLRFRVMLNTSRNCVGVSFMITGGNYQCVHGSLLDGDSLILS